MRLNNYKKNEELEKLFAACEEAKELLAISMHLEDEDKVEELTNSLEEVFEKISDICAEKNKNIVKEHIGIKDDSIEGFS